MWRRWRRFFFFPLVECIIAVVRTGVISAYEFEKCPAAESHGREALREVSAIFEEKVLSCISLYYFVYAPLWDIRMRLKQPTRGQ